MSDELALRRRQRDGEPDNALVTCGCGSPWFKLVDPDHSEPLVNVTTRGRLVAYTGHMVCDSCGAAPELP